MASVRCFYTLMSLMYAQKTNWLQNAFQFIGCFPFFQAAQLDLQGSTPDYKLQIIFCSEQTEKKRKALIPCLVKLSQVKEPEGPKISCMLGSAFIAVLIRRKVTNDGTSGIIDEMTLFMSPSSYGWD